MFYESPHRVREHARGLRSALRAGARRAAVAREITKLHETLTAARLSQLAQRAAAEADLRARRDRAGGRGSGARRAAGEAGADGHGGALDRVLEPLLAELPLKQAARLAAQIAAVRDNEAYKRALELKQAYGAP